MRMRTWRKNKKREGFMVRTAKEVTTYAVRKKILTIVLAMLSAFVGLIYIISIFYKETGSFTISLNKQEMTEYGLSLSEKSTMDYATSVLNAKISKNMTNISESDIPRNVDSIDGEHNGKNFIAYTFYLLNSGTKELSYKWILDMHNVTNGLDEAIRVKVYINGNSEVYAKVRSDGSGLAEPDTVPFSTIDKIAEKRVDDFKPGDYTKFTIVIWIEGNDPDCVDWVIGGSMRLEMNFYVDH